jgi:hypothetical protein
MTMFDNTSPKKTCGHAFKLNTRAYKENSIKKENLSYVFGIFYNKD